MDIDFFLMRLDKSLPLVAAKWNVYVLPVITVLCLISTIILTILFKRQKDYIGVQKLVSCIMVITTLCLAVRIPLGIKFLGDDALYTDYLEYKWCEIFARVNVDTPAAMNIIIGLLKVGLAVQGLIMMFLPKKEKTLMTSRKTVWFCLLTCVAGVCLYIPSMQLFNFIAIDWVSKLDENVERECCIPFPSDVVINTEYYQRDVYLGLFMTTHAFPLLTMLTVGIILSIRLYFMKRVSQSDTVETYQHKEVIRAISVCMFGYCVLSLPGLIALLFSLLVYAQVDLGWSFDEINAIISYINMADTFFMSILPPVTLLIFCLCDTRFRIIFMHFIGRRRN